MRHFQIMFLSKLKKKWLRFSFKKLKHYSKKIPPIGVDDFRKIVEDKDMLYVDKTLMIKELIDDKSEVVLITRPRRWGKTLNMSMIQHFFAPSVLDKETKGMFEDYKISKVEDGKYLKDQGKYPVVYITFKDLTTNNFSSFLQRFSIVIQKLYREHEYILSQVNSHEKNSFNKYLNGEMDQNYLSFSLEFLSEMLYKYSNQKRVFILIDEYDTPLQHAYVEDKQKFLEDVTSFMRNLFSSTLKNNAYLHKAILTGILRIAKANLFTGVNNFEEYTMLDQNYSTSFGYSDLEIKFMLQESDLKMTSFDSIKQWYNGYKIYQSTLYNPWSINKFIKNNGELKLYWINTSQNSLIKKLITGKSVEIQKDLFTLISGGFITKTIDEQMTLKNLEKSESAIWNLFYFTGYLTTKEVSFNSKRQYVCDLVIPNKEVNSLFKIIVEEWFNDEMGEQKYHTFIQSLLDEDVEKFTNELSDYLIFTSSYYDFGNQEKEKTYHLFFLGLIANLNDSHIIHSNKESGLGRYDLMLIPKSKSKHIAFIIEFKQSKKEEELENLAKKAIKQIDESLYLTEVCQYEHIKSVIKLGLAFKGKQVKSAFEKIDLTDKI